MLTNSIIWQVTLAICFTIYVAFSLLPDTITINVNHNFDETVWVRVENNHSGSVDVDLSGSVDVDHSGSITKY